METCPLGGGAIVLFAPADRVAIAVDPAKAYALEDEPEFRYQVPGTALTSYVVITAADLARYFDAVLELAAESLEWRAAPRVDSWCARCGVGCATKRDACPQCWVEIDDDGKRLCPEPNIASSPADHRGPGGGPAIRNPRAIAVAQVVKVAGERTSRFPGQSGRQPPRRLIGEGP